MKMRAKEGRPTIEDVKKAGEEVEGGEGGKAVGERGGETRVKRSRKRTEEMLKGITRFLRLFRPVVFGQFWGSSFIFLQIYIYIYLLKKFYWALFRFGLRSGFRFFFLNIFFCVYYYSSFNGKFH